jgi:hypothetical protein
MELEGCFVYLSLFPNFGTADTNFPPPIKFIYKIGKMIHDNIDDNGSLANPYDAITSVFDSDELSELYELTREISPNLSPELLNRVIFLIKSSPESVDLENETSFIFLSKWCNCFFSLVAWIPKINDCYLKDNIDGNLVSEFLIFLEKFSLRLFQISHLLIGYWTAQTMIKKRNYKSSLVKTEHKIRNQKIIEKLIKENKYKNKRKLILKAMELTDRGERTVQNMIKRSLEKEST